MYAVGRLGSYITRGVYTVSGPFHPFGGAVDIVVVEQPDGSFKSSPWNVRFGKFQGVLKAREKVVNINVNGVDGNFHMYLNPRGEAYFLREVERDEGESVSSSSSDETDEQSLKNRRPMKSKTYDFDAKLLNSGEQIDASNGKTVARTNSRRARILGLVFGRRSMKQDGYQDGGNGDGVERTDSLERAEIAANLLDVKWSTNLATMKAKKDNASRFSVSDTSDGKGDRDRLTNDGQGQVGSSMQDDAIEIGLDHYMVAEETGSCNVQMVNHYNSGFENQEFSVEEATVEMSSLGATEQIVETIILHESTKEEKLQEISRNIDKSSLQDADQDANSEGFGISEEESGSNKIPSYIYCEKSENLKVHLDVLKEQSEETLYLTSGGPEEVHFCAETLHAATELLPEDTVAQQAEEIGLETLHTESSDDNYLQQTNPSPPSIYDHDEMNLEVPLAVSQCRTQVVSDESILGTEVESKNSCSISGLSQPNQEIQNQKDIGDKITWNELQPAFESVGGSEQLNGDCDLAKAVSLPVSDSSDEEQFFFSDINDFKHRRTQGESNFPDCVNKENHLSSCPEGTNEVNKCLDTNNESFSSQDSFFQKNQLADTENLIGNSKVASSSICIPKLHRTNGAEVGQLAESLPNMQSCIDNLGAEDFHHPLSRSLDSNSKPLEWMLHSKDMSHYTNNENQASLEFSNKDHFHHSDNIRNDVVNPVVEMSLCKHLLYEGMGAEAASQAFDAEKLDIDKFSFIGPEVVKNDRLVVRIGGYYFPWDAAASIVLGIVAFGSKIIFEPKGNIPVDQVEKSLVGNPSEAIITTGGSWWPFSFRRSRSRKTVQPTLTDTSSSGAENVSDGNIGKDNENNVAKPHVSKKMIRAFTPTSEELASLNLKEGSNVVTFTFSTAMLGKQKVDARIYLWKWNTRIVISDVDGTITKSDVLGQFMPLVGMDWSQTGVAPLFSAIKENGYQLLFLSARAISQAYHTRQFLVNLKQDGKALPDGPVVISPDGLFPSLYREVIRRAPHEFKIQCLEGIKALFPSDCNPFYAGFGNRDTDEISYLKVGIPKGKIFIINPKGEVAVNRRVDTKSYTSIHALVHGMFPAMTTSSEQEDFNSWNYWRLPPAVIDF